MTVAPSRDQGGAPGRGERGAPSLDRRILPLAYAALALCGWTGLLVASLIRVLQDGFGLSDAEFGLVYLAGALGFATASLLSGFLAERVGRGRVVQAGVAAIAGGLAIAAVAPTWPLFVLGSTLASAGCGTVSPGLSSVVMDLSVGDSGGGLNRLHVFYGVGALAAPTVVGVLVALGVDWRLIPAGTSLVALGLATQLGVVGLVRRRPRPVEVASPGVAGDDAPRASAARRRAHATGTGIGIALAALGVAVALYCGAESGVSSWLVGFLADEPMAVATFALSLFWVGLTVGRIVASRTADRFSSVPFTVTCAFAGGAAILVAVAGPAGAPRIALLLAAGFAFGPVYPMIISIGGSLAPHRAAAVAGALSAAGVVGSIAYPPLVGLIPGPGGLAAGVAGAGLLIGASGVAVLVAGWLAGDRAAPAIEREVVPVAEQP
jgi:fucose permease